MQTAVNADMVFDAGSVQTFIFQPFSKAIVHADPPPPPGRKLIIAFSQLLI
jgi:hypothetical protein